MDMVQVNTLACCIERGAGFNKVVSPRIRFNQEHLHITSLLSRSLMILFIMSADRLLIYSDSFWTTFVLVGKD